MTLREEIYFYKSSQSKKSYRYILFDTCVSPVLGDASLAEAICTNVRYPPWANTDVSPAI